MDFYRMSALLREFPFISFAGAVTPAPVHLPHPRDCEAFAVKRADEKLMDFVPRRESVGGNLCSVDGSDDVWFVLADGEVIQSAVWQESEVGHVCGDRERHNGESIASAIARHDVASRLTFIVVCSKGWQVSDHYSTRGWEATIYKPAKDLTWADVAIKRHGGAQQALSAEISAL